MSHWYCKKCLSEKSPRSITFEENCDDCGTPAVFVEDLESGILFNRYQSQFYKLSGKKPLLSSDKGVCGLLEYVRYLEMLLSNPPTKENIGG